MQVVRVRLSAISFFPFFCLFVLFFVVVFSDSDGSKRTANEDREESDYNAEGIFALETYRYSNR